MANPKTTCPQCGAEFLQATADANGGLCRSCRKTPEWRRTEKMDHDDIADTIGAVMRLLLAVVFAIVFGGIGFAVGAWIWTGLGILLAMFTTPAGFVYGLFFPEINFLIRVGFRLLLRFVEPE